MAAVLRMLPGIGEQLIWGAVPGIKYSYLGDGEQETLILINDFGGEKLGLGKSLSSFFIV